MKRKTRFADVLATGFAALAALSIWCFPVFADVSSAYAQTDGFRVELIRGSSPLYFERGAAFDFSALPEYLPVRGISNDGAVKSRVAYVAWNVTDENRLSAERFESFSVSGEWVTAKDTPGGTETFSVSDASIAPNAEIRFSDRRAVGGFSVKLRPQRTGVGSSGKLIGISFLLKVNGGFSAGAEVDFEYSDGRGFRTVPLSDWDYSDTLDAFDNSVTLFFGSEGVTEELLNSFLNDRYFYRLNVKSGLFAGISNTVTIESGTLVAPEQPTEPDDSGIAEPNGGADGNRGGGVSFWSTPSGTAAGIGIGAAVVIVSIGVGFGISLLVMKRGKRKHGKKDV